MTLSPQLAAPAPAHAVAPHCEGVGLYALAEMGDGQRLEMAVRTTS